MPIFKAGPKLVYYAHVPKCGGMAVAWYLRERFGAVAFTDKAHTSHAPATLWSKTSPQHIDTLSLSRLFPEGFFDASFTIVRHPVPRLVSAFHFQVEVERRVSEHIEFSDWLEDIEERRATDPFVFDNHVRPMSEIVPAGAQVFHMEHGLDSLIPWFDAITGTHAAPRALPEINRKGEYSKAGTVRAEPSAADLERIARIYAEDFSRFGYDPERPSEALAPPPVLPEGFTEERDAARREFDRPIRRLKSKLGAILRA